MTISIENVSFGVPAAERDDDLIRCFVSSNTYENLKAGKKFVILGNRGSGKSAIFRKFSEEERKKGNHVISLSPEDYSYEILSETLKAEAEGSWAKQGAYAAAWKYLILVLVMKELSNKGRGFKRGPEAKIYTYLRDKHQGTETNPIGLMISYLKRMEGIKVGKYEAGVKAKELQKLYSLEEISSLIPLIDSACQNKKFFVLVDELDKGWDASEDAISYVAGLFNSATSINAQLNNVKVYVSLRKELYENIPALYEDAQKVRDIIETIEWDEPKLLELISKRIVKNAPELFDQYPHLIWNTVFSETLDYRQTKSFNYIVDRTLYRPREIIQFCNDIADYSRQNLELTESGIPFNYKQIAEAEHFYSESRLKDICAEYRFQYPGLQSVMETFRGHSYNLDRDYLEEHLLNIILKEKPLSKEAYGWCEDADPDNLIDILWSVGFIRAQAVGGIKARRRSGSQYIGSHQISSLNLRGISRFHIHPMFRSYLGLKESKKIVAQQIIKHGQP